MQNSDINKSISKKILSSKEPRVVNYYVAIAVNIILLYFFNNIVFASISFLSSKDLIRCLWAVNLSLGVGIIGNFIFLLYRPRWFYHLIQAILSALVILAVYTFYRVFPFTFSSDVFGTVTRIILLIIMAGTAIGFIAELVKFAITWMHRQPPSVPQTSPVSPLPPEPSPTQPLSDLPPEPPPVSPPSSPPPEPPPSG
jgi:hypothetical protein